MSAPQSPLRSAPQNKFHFKSKSKPKRRHEVPRPSRRRSRSRSPSSSHRSHRSGRSQRYQDYSRSLSPSSRPQSPHRPRPASPETAFRESLFDALADDEGAAYWEGVYGQPIHTYSRYKASVPEPGDGGPTVDKNGDPVLERMSDEEYASYVRGRMWEKSRAGLEEERAKTRAERKRRREEEVLREVRERARRKAQTQEDGGNGTGAGERDSHGGNNRSRGDHRNSERAAWDKVFSFAAESRSDKNRDKEFRAAWDNYSRAWKDLKAGLESMDEVPDTSTGKMGRKNQTQMPWPTVSGSAKDITAAEVEGFFHQAVSTGAVEADAKQDAKTCRSALVKAERVRWHPDKMMQRYGGLVSNPEVMRSVTAVFQILDSFYNSLKAGSGGTGSGA